MRVDRAKASEQNLQAQDQHSRNIETGKGNMLAGDNPLARARSGARTQKNRTHHKASQLWHRKSGGGYILFIRYYANQAKYLLSGGTRESADREHFDEANEGRNNINQNQNNNTHHPPRGESRASKRRRRKRKRDGSSDHPNSSSDGASHSVAVIGTKELTNQSSSRRILGAIEASSSDIHPLLQGFSFIHDELENNTVQLLLPFLESLSRPLPLSVRIRCGLRPKQLSRVRAELEQEFGELLERTIPNNDGSFIYQAKQKSSVHGNKNTVLSKATLGKDAPELKSWVMANGEAIARQELGSMLPVLLLARGGDDGANAKVQWIGPGSRVLDLCASPGSKTLQALEVIGPTGKIKANDINSTRLESLRDAVQRANQSNSNRVKYSNLDARKFPIPPQREKLYDTVLCDVPCSGDGTIRKDSHILPNWTPQTSNALHSLQVSTLVRALHCLRVGGVMCYSTCSLNPVENEAVVAAALVQVVHAELVEFAELPGFQLRPGVSNWSVADHSDDDHNQFGDGEVPSLRWFETYHHAAKCNMPHAVASLWPPENSAKLNLERCGRLWPQDHDCGGFFVALLRRTKA